MKADGRLGGDLNARLVACWPVMPDERAQCRRMAARWSAWPRLITTRRATLVGRSATESTDSVGSVKQSRA